MKNKRKRSKRRKQEKSYHRDHFKGEPVSKQPKRYIHDDKENYFCNSKNIIETEINRKDTEQKFHYDRALS